MIEDVYKRQVVSGWTKIPVNKLTESEAGRLAKLEQILHKRVIGQELSLIHIYISKSEIGTRSLSSVLITEDKKGAGLSVSTHNINYCTVGMYRCV